MTIEEQRVHGTQNLERQRLCRQRRKYSTNIPSVLDVELDEEDNPTKKKV